MSKSVDTSVAVVVPNWNGDDSLQDCLDSLLNQSLKSLVIVVDNGSTDKSLEILDKYSKITVIKHQKNLGFAGGVNAGIKKAMELDYEYIALFNNDAIADKNWLQSLYATLENNPKTGIATSKILGENGKTLDSTGDYYTIWGLPYPRGRGETNTDKYDKQTEIFAASGGASLYRVTMLQEIGLFDEDFFAYYEDVDISFRAQWAGWKVAYEPKAIVNHKIGATSGKIKGFTTYQTMKNLPLLFVKNAPAKYFWKIYRRFALAHTLFFLKAIVRGHGWSAIKGDFMATRLIYKASKQGKVVRQNAKVSEDYIWSMLVHDLPPNAHKLRKLRALFSRKAR